MKAACLSTAGTWAGFALAAAMVLGSFAVNWGAQAEKMQRRLIGDVCVE